jgi:hypothetical protein
VLIAYGLALLERLDGGEPGSAEAIAALIEVMREQTRARGERIAGRQEHHEPQRAGVFGPLSGGPLDDARPLPEPEEEWPDGIQARLGSPAQDRRHVARAVRRRSRSSVRISAFAGPATSLTRKLRKPSQLSRSASHWDLRPGQRARGAGHGRYLREVDGHSEAQGVRLHRQLAGPEGLERHREAAGGRAEGPEQALHFLDGRPGDRS